MVNIRPITEQDRQAVQDTLVRAYHKTNKPVIRDTWEGFIPAVADEIFIQQECKSVIVNETFVLCYLAVESWWTHVKVLVEYSVMRIYPDGPGKFSDVCEALEILAKEEGCKHIQVGTMFTPNDEPLARKYRSNGYEQFCVTLVKTLKE